MLAAASASLIPNQTRRRWTTSASGRRWRGRSTSARSSRTRTAASCKAANPSGLVPAFEEYYDEDVVASSGFTFDAEEAKSILADAGLQGHRRRRVRRDAGRRADRPEADRPGRLDRLDGGRPRHRGGRLRGGHQGHRRLPRRGRRRRRGRTGDFDLLHQGNEGSQQHAVDLLQLHVLPAHPGAEARGQLRPVREQGGLGAGAGARGPRAARRVHAETLPRSRRSSTDLPAIPLWYNGAWAQDNESWTNWPRRRRAAEYAPIMWNNWLQMGGILHADRARAGRRRLILRPDPACAFAPGAGRSSTARSGGRMRGISPGRRWSTA